MIALLPGRVKAQSTEIVRIQIDLSKTYQIIEHFGASDAWAGQFVGQWPDEKRQAVADLLFSLDEQPDGRPEGIGLSLWRFNLGAGSAQQGETSGIRDPWRRAESFLDERGAYDGNRQAGQRWLLRAARDRGVPFFLAFSNSPPVPFTRTGKAYGLDGKSNLAPERYEAFAAYLVDALEGIQRTDGIRFDYVSPVNEPQWDWSDGGQEGSAFNNAEIAGIVSALDAALAASDLPTRITVGEAGKLNYLLADEDKPGRGNQIEAFFTPQSPLYLGNLARVDRAISAHSYFTTSPFDQAVTLRRKVAEKVATVPGLRFWQSEYCILGDNAGEIDGGGRDPGIGPALYVARAIHNDLAVAGATSWQWWLALSPYDYKDGLVYVDKIETDGGVYPARLLWALGNYSRFIRPGAVRLETRTSGGPADPKQVLVSSYRNPALKQVIAVAINSGDVPVAVRLDVEGASVTSVRTYVTSQSDDLKPGPASTGTDNLLLAPRSITTLVADLNE